MKSLSAEEFAAALRIDPAWASKLTEPVEILGYCQFQVETIATANIGKIIFIESGCTSSQNREEVSWISGLAGQEPRIHGIVAHVPLENATGVRAELAALAKFQLVKGVRRNLQGETAPDFCLQPDFVAGVQALEEFGFSFDLCILHQQLPAAIELVRRCPEVVFILDHCGKPAIRESHFEPWAVHLKALGELPNVSCKISGLLTEADLIDWKPCDLQPFIRHALDCFGVDRVLFGGDWPVLTLAGDYLQWLGALDFCLPGADESDLKKLFQSNAENIYRI